MRTRLRVLGATVAASVAAVAVPMLTSSEAHAARFTGGDVVVYRVGAGATALSNAAAPVFLDEYGPTGTKVQSVALPTASVDGNAPLTASGQSRSEGLVDRSADGRFLVVTGYAAAPGTTGPSGTSLTASDPTQVGRTVGLVDANGIADTSTVLKGADVPKIIRSATSTNGDRIWAAGGNGGIATTTLGSATVAKTAGSATSNISSLTIQGGQLFSSGILSDRLAAVGSKTPTSGTLSDLPGLPDNLLTYGYAFADVTTAGYAGTTLDTLYVADASSRAGTLDKYRFNGSSWALAGYVDLPGASGVVANAQGSSVSLAVTTPSSLVTLTDAAAPAATFTPSAPVVLATAPANTEFRGVALAPTAAAGPSVFVRTPATGTAIPLGGSTKVTAYVNSPSGVGKVQAKIGKGAYVTATHKGHVYTAVVPTSGLKKGKTTVTVRATDTASTPATTTVVRQVKASGKAAPAGALSAGKYSWTSKLVKRKGTWTKYKTSHSPSHKGIESQKKGSTATFKVYGHKLVLTFDRSAKAGIVKVTVGGKTTKVDLYSKSGKPVKKTWKFHGALKSRKVVVTVLGTKNTASHGILALLAALQVKS